MEDRGDRGGAAREEGLVADRTDGHETPGLAGSIVAPESEVGQFVERVMDPGEEHIIGRELLELRREVRVAMDEGGDLLQKPFLASVVGDSRGQEDAFVRDQVVRWRIRHQPLIGFDANFLLDIPEPVVAGDGKGGVLVVGVIDELDNCPVLAGTGNRRDATF